MAHPRGESGSICAGGHGELVQMADAASTHMERAAMPTDPMECRNRALRCSDLAERATNSQVKAVLTYLAQHWLKMAVDLERAQAWPEGFEPSAKN
jgi:hypothetical protein